MTYIVRIPANSPSSLDKISQDSLRLSTKDIVNKLDHKSFCPPLLELVKLNGMLYPNKNLPQFKVLTSNGKQTSTCINNIYKLMEKLANHEFIDDRKKASYMAANLVAMIIDHHIFVDGNFRTAMLSAYVTLLRAGYYLKCQPVHIDAAIRDISEIYNEDICADDAIKKLASFFHDHSTSVYSFDVAKKGALLDRLLQFGERSSEIRAELAEKSDRYDNNVRRYGYSYMTHENKRQIITFQSYKAKAKSQKILPHFFKPELVSNEAAATNSDENTKESQKKGKESIKPK